MEYTIYHIMYSLCMYIHANLRIVKHLQTDYWGCMIICRTFKTFCPRLALLYCVVLRYWSILPIFLITSPPNITWWRHQVETFSALLAICAGNSPVSGEFPAQKPVTRSFDVFFDVRLIKRLSKRSRGWWFETLSYPLWRHRNDIV